MKYVLDRSELVKDELAQELERLQQKTNWPNLALRHLPRLIHVTGLRLQQIGFLVPYTRDDGNGYFLEWADYKEGEFPIPLDDREWITIFDKTGRKIVRKQFGEFTDDEVLNFGVEHYWVRELEGIDSSYCWSFTDPEFQSLEQIQKSSGWISDARKKRKRVLKPLDFLETRSYALSVHRLPHLDPKAVYIGILDVEKKQDVPYPPFNDMEFTVVNTNSKVVAKKTFQKFSFDELKSYFSDHFWVYTPSPII